MMITAQPGVRSLPATRVVARPAAVATTSEAVSISGLCKSYGALQAVKNLDLEIKKGEMFALLGRNGAGKTTTIEILEGYRKRDAGSVSVLGLDPQNRGQLEQLKQRIGVMLQSTTIYQTARVGDVMRVFSRYYKHPANTEDLLELVGMQNFKRSLFKDLSGGQKQRVSLALALVGSPDLVFLDEPTAAMDPQSRHQTWEIIRGLRERGVTVLLTTHYMEEAEVLADRVAIIDRGSMVALDTTLGLSNRFGGDSIAFRATPGLPLTELASMAGARHAEEIKPGQYVINADDTDKLNFSLVLWASNRGTALHNIEIKHATLEEIFLKLTGEEVRN